MQRIGRFVALLLLVLWLPVTMHCTLESIPGLSFIECCQHGTSHSHNDSDCDEDLCKSIESGDYNISDNPRSPAPPLVLPVAVAFDSAHLTLTGCCDEVSIDSSPPPELAVGWQFFVRAAVEPRSPSSAV